VDKQWKKELTELAKLMNSMNDSPAPIMPEIIECFNAMMTPADVAFLKKVGTKRRTYAELQSLSGLNDAEFKQLYHRMMNTSFLTHYTPEGEPDYFELSSIMIGWFEGASLEKQMGPDRIAFLQHLYKFFAKFDKLNFFPVRNLLNLKLSKAHPVGMIIGAGDIKGSTRTIEMNKKVVDSPGAKNGPAPLAKAMEYLEKFDKPNSIAVAECFCRRHFEVNGEPCRYDFPIESCICFGSTARQAVEGDMAARFVTKDEAADIIVECYKKGAVLNIHWEHSNPSEPEFALCLCCPDCCGFLASYNRSRLPLNLRTLYLAKQRRENCVGCGACLKYCATGALAMVGDKVKLDESRCIGCGQCVYRCHKDALFLIERQADVFLPILPKPMARFKAGE